MSTEKILVTGGAGFIGSNLVNELNARGHEVTVIDLYNTDRENYKHEKQKVAEQVIEILEGHFSGIRNQIEVIDVCTLMTWERYMGGTQGWFNFPNRKLDFSMREDMSDKKFKTTLPGLSNFYFAGVWASMMGSLAHNAQSGKTIIRRICKKDGKQFDERFC